MRRALLILPALAIAFVLWAWTSGADARLVQWAAGWQRDFQNALAGALRALRGGEPGAFGLMIGVCFAYGVVHAVGPGHGKVLIGGYGVGRRVPVFRLSAIAVAASMGQAVTALAVVGIGILALAWTRTKATGIVETVLAPASTVAIALFGLWLVVRGSRRLWRVSRMARPSGEPKHHAHAHEGCGHRHGPTLDEIRTAATRRDVAALIGGIAMRPCSGAVLLLVLTWHMDILAAGVAGTLAMALGTSAVTVAVAMAAVTVRETALLSLAGRAHPLRIMPFVETAAGATIILLALRMLHAM